ncbi:MAG: nucleotidyltransferase domain-containing protein [Clostridiales Family XIII bacterium]|nr:nucleotidyltransferase domain-containing protein [Clostridiales Family XIII bacterium]
MYTISEISSIVTPIAEAYGIRKMAVFGSYARGEATKDSDLDFHIIDRGALRGLFRLSGFNIALKEKLQMDVDVVTSGSLSEEFLKNISGEEIVVYEA